MVPCIDASIAPRGTDLRIGRVSNETRLTGPFMNLIQGGIGASYFVTERGAIYTGLHAQHISNAGFNGTVRNFSLDSFESVVVGVSWFIRRAAPHSLQNLAPGLDDPHEGHRTGTGSPHLALSEYS